jgi:hypothetical protein
MAECEKMTGTGDLRGSKDWHEDCLRWRGELLQGVLAHWCSDWDELPVDETTREIDACTCDVDDLILHRITGDPAGRAALEPRDE